MNKHLPAAWDFVKTWRMVLIPACVILLQVIVFQFLWPSPSHAPTPQEIEQLTTAAALNDVAAAAPPQPTAAVMSPMADCIARNPFELPSSFLNEEPDVQQDVPTPQIVERVLSAEELAWQATVQQKRVQAIYQSARGAVAIIDGQLVRPGDLLDAGLRVSEIRMDGLVVERIAPATAERDRTSQEQ